MGPSFPARATLHFLGHVPVPSRRQLTAVSYVRLTCWCRMAGTVDKIVPLIRAQLSERY